MSPCAELESAFAAERRQRGVVTAFVSLAEETAAARDCLSDSERSQFHRLRFPKRRLDWLRGRLSAKMAVRALLGKPDLSPRRIEILREPGGAPRVRVLDLPPPHEPVGVSISHSGDIGGAAAYHRSQLGPVGLDVEKIEPLDPRVYSLAFRPEETAWILQVSNAAANLRALALWTAKEAALKAAEVGLSVPLHGVAVRLRGTSGQWIGRTRLAAGNLPSRSFLVRTIAAGGCVASLALP